jgi:hypothetical protein
MSPLVTWTLARQSLSWTFSSTSTELVPKAKEITPVPLLSWSRTTPNLSAMPTVFSTFKTVSLSNRLSTQSRQPFVRPNTPSSSTTRAATDLPRSINYFKLIYSLFIRIILTMRYSLAPPAFLGSKDVIRAPPHLAELLMILCTCCRHRISDA